MAGVSSLQNRKESRVFALMGFYVVNFVFTPYLINPLWEMWAALPG